MAIFKCKMCGGTIEFNPGETVGICDSCGTKQTLPKLDDDRKANLYDRANHFRRNNDFDKAMSIYEQILEEDRADAEAYWSLVLCRYGIEYVEDPETHRRVPTVNRTQPTSIFMDADYKSALQHADIYQRSVYEEEAKTINEIQKGILEISSKEDPYDVFICYKETDNNGRRTQDSVIANDIYHQLTNEGFKVFYAAISLEDKLGTEYEPYIFSALNSAKVMLAIGTRSEYFNAPWVKNEWSRYLKLTKHDRSKLLIPCYRNMDPYDLPEEFAHLQAQDMSKIGFINDIVRGIKKVIEKDQPPQTLKETIIQTSAVGNTVALMKRGKIALEDKDWEKADGFFEEVLNQDAENAEAYIGKLLAKRKQSTLVSLFEYFHDLNKNSEYAVLAACPEATLHIQDVVLKNEVVGFLDKEDILNKYAFDRTYRSNLPCRKEQKENELSVLSSERLLARAQQYATGELKQTIEKGLASVYKVLDDRIAEAEEHDAVQIARISAEYNAFVESIDKEIPELHNEAVKAKAVADEKNRIAEEAARIEAEERRIAEEKKKEENLRITEAQRKRNKQIIMIVIPLLIVAIVTGVYFSNKRDFAAKTAADAEYYAEMHDFSTAEVGDHRYFGLYEQNNDPSDGKEEIEWIVLRKDSDAVIVVSARILDVQPYNKSSTDVSWDNSSLCAWLNGTFMQTAFSAIEQAKIEDKYVGVLSKSAAEEYFKTNDDRKCLPTMYASAQGYTFDDEWWLSEDPKYNDSTKVYLAWAVDKKGEITSINKRGNADITTERGIRPAMVILF